MAPRSFLLPNIALLLLFTISPVKSEVATTTATTTEILDVTASIQSTHEALSLHHQQKHPETETETETELKQAQAKTERETEAQKTQQSYGYMSVPIHSRISLSTPDQHHRHKDYRSLTESRLARDSARVNSLLTKLDLKLQGISHADLTKPSSSSSQQQQQYYNYYTSAAAAANNNNNNNNNNLAAPLTSGSSQGSGEYFARVGVGRPSTPYYLVLDTGSDVSWLQCQPCSSCYQQSDPVFRPSSSSTYSPVPCSSPLCNKLEISACGTRTHTCLYQVSYGDGSFTVGNFITETLSFGGSTLDRLAMGCGHDNEGLFVASAGLLGLGGGQLSLTSQIKATSFSYCLVDRDSGKSSTLEFNSPRPPAPAVTTRLIRDGGVDTFYYVSLTGMTVGGRPLSISPSVFAVSESGGGGVIVDSGTAVTRLPTEAYNSLRDAFSQLTQHLPKAEGVALFDTCYDFSSMTQARVPTVGFRFAGGGELGLPAKNYLIPVDSKGTFCFAFAPTSASMSIIGNVQQQGTRVHYDLANSAVSFSQNTC